MHKFIKQQLPQALDNWFPQIFMPATRADQFWAVLMYLLTELNYMEEILFVLVQFLLGIIFKTFIEIFYLIS